MKETKKKKNPLDIIPTDRSMAIRLYRHLQKVADYYNSNSRQVQYFLVLQKMEYLKKEFNL